MLSSISSDLNTLQRWNIKDLFGAMPYEIVSQTFSSFRSNLPPFWISNKSLILDCTDDIPPIVLEDLQCTDDLPHITADDFSHCTEHSPQ